MILQRLISEAQKLPDLGTEVHKAILDYNGINEVKSATDLEILHIASTRKFQAETVRRTQANLKTIELNVVKAKHAITEDIEDFV
jgi:hypothetical protein